MCNVGTIKLSWIAGIVVALLMATLLLLDTSSNMMILLSVVCLILAVFHLHSAFVSARLIYSYAAYLVWIKPIQTHKIAVILLLLLLMHVAVLLNLKHGNIFVLASGELLVNALLTRCVAELICRKFKNGKSKLNDRELDYLRILGGVMGFCMESKSY